MSSKIPKIIPETRDRLRRLAESIALFKDPESVSGERLFREHAAFYFDVSWLCAYGGHTVKLSENNEIHLLNTYGDEDKFDFDAKDIGICIIYQGYAYTFDLMQEDIYRTTEMLCDEPSFYSGKRAFYSYPEKLELSLRGFNPLAETGKHHDEAKDWVSGPRTIFQLEQL